MIRPLKMLSLACLLCLPMANGGCAIVGYIAAVTPGPPMKARYAGLAGQNVAVLVWADRAASFDYPNLMPEVASAIQGNLKSEIAANPKEPELLNTTFADAKQVYRWQKNHPELENRALSEVAPGLAAQLGVTRIVYVEISPFSTRDPRTEALLKGNAGVTIRVAEVSGGAVSVAFDEANVKLEFPEQAPEGVPATDQMTDAYIYKGLVYTISKEVALRFFSYAEQ